MSEPETQQAGLVGLRPEQVAVLLVDLQNEFCAGTGAVRDTARNAETARRANDFAERAAELGAHVIYSKQLADMERLDRRQQRWDEPNRLCVPGTPGAELFVQPVAGSKTFTKSRYDIWRSEPFVKYLDDQALRDQAWLVASD